jgi:hypothetical protein
VERKDYKYALITDGVIEFFVDDEADEADKILNTEPKANREALKSYVRQKQGGQDGAGMVAERLGYVYTYV